MYAGSLHLHNLLRWVILILLMMNVYRHVTAAASPFGEKDRKWGLWLMISSHIMLLLGLYQYLMGGVGYQRISNLGMGEVMKTGEYRYWAVEHISGMIIAILLITVAYGVRKKNISDFAKHRRSLILYTLALLLILISMPWPWRNGIGPARPWLPGM